MRILPVCLSFQQILALLVDFSQNQPPGKELQVSTRLVAANYEQGREASEVSYSEVVKAM